MVMPYKTYVKHMFLVGAKKVYFAWSIIPVDENLT